MFWATLCTKVPVPFTVTGIEKFVPVKVNPLPAVYVGSVPSSTVIPSVFCVTFVTLLPVPVYEIGKLKSVPVNVKPEPAV